MTIAPARNPLGAPVKANGLSATAPQGRGSMEDAAAAASPRSRRLDLSGRVVLLATERSGGGVAGTHVALALATAHGAIVHVVSVVDTRPALIAPPLDLARSVSNADGDSAARAQQVAEIHAALAATTGRAIDWPVRIEMGTPASAIVEEARRLGAALIIVGLHQRTRLNRALNDMTALTVMRHAPCPVLGVVPGTTALPTRVLVAMDFGETSLVAAATACAIVGEEAHLAMAYVAPLAALLPEDGELVIHDLGVQAAFTRTARDLGDDGIACEHVVLHHELSRTQADMILEYAEDTESDLIAAGSVRRGRRDRWLMGSVSADLARDGRRSVLIVPPPVTHRH